MKVRIRELSIEEILQIMSYISMVLLGFLIISDNNRGTYFFYILIISISLFLISASSVIQNKYCSEYLFALGIFFMMLILALRNKTGMDDWTYEYIFNNARQGGILEYINRSDINTNGLELGYLLLNYFIYHLTDGNYYFAQIFFSCLSISIWGMCIWKYRNFLNVPLAILIVYTHYYFFVLSIAIVRMFIAIPIVFYSLQFLWKKNGLKYLSGILVASMFHRSSFIMLIFVFFCIKTDILQKHWKKIILSIVIVMPIIFLFVARFVVPYLSDRYIQYANILSFHVSLGDFDVLPVIIIGCVELKKISLEYKDQYIIGLILLCTSCVISVCSSMVGLNRLMFYTNIGMILVVSIIGKQEKRNTILENFISPTLIMYAFIYLFYTNLFSNKIMYYLFPYRGIWFEV